MLMGLLMLLHTLFVVAAMFMYVFYFIVFDGMLMACLMFSHTSFTFAATFIVFLMFLRFGCYAHGFFDVVAQLITTDNLHS